LAAQPVNRLAIAGRICTEPDTRVSPAGVPITRFTLEHESQQPEAGGNRQVRCRIRVVAAGPEWQQVAQQPRNGDRIRVEGFVSQAGYRSAEFSLVLHAQRIEVLDD